jgi:hypothetical protein
LAGEGERRSPSRGRRTVDTAADKPFFPEKFGAPVRRTSSPSLWGRMMNSEPIAFLSYDGLTVRRYRRSEWRSRKATRAPIIHC